MTDWKQEARDAWDAPSWREAAVASVKENSHPHPTPTIVLLSAMANRRLEKIGVIARSPRLICKPRRFPR